MCTLPLFMANAWLSFTKSLHIIQQIQRIILMHNYAQTELKLGCDLLIVCKFAAYHTIMAIGFSFALCTYLCADLCSKLCTFYAKCQPGLSRVAIYKKSATFAANFLRIGSFAHKLGNFLILYNAPNTQQICK